MHWNNGLDQKFTVGFSLRDLRQAKGIKQNQLAEYLDISKSLYHAIEYGHKPPSAIVLFRLAMLYKTSMDFIYHAFCRQILVCNYLDDGLEYALREANRVDFKYIKKRTTPEPVSPIQKLPAALINASTVNSCKEDFPPPKLYRDTHLVASTAAV